MEALARTLAVFGTASDVGKSIIVTALCRILRDRGVDVAPFKAQNLSNNSWVTRDGGEMGRAQIVQAQAARVEPHVDMNPVLLKPSGDRGSQIVLHGRPVGDTRAAGHLASNEPLARAAAESLARLRRTHQVILLEGAGSCAEVNLRGRDFVNFRMARESDAPVILVGDIERGGVFAQLVGTLEVLPEDDRKRVAGFIVNRFRGDPALFDDGIAYLEERTGLPVLALVPFFPRLEIDAEDSVSVDALLDPPAGALPGRINVAVIALPHISNFTDFDPLAREPAVNLNYLARPRALAGYDLLLLPGTKNVRHDLRWLRETGWTRRIGDYLDAGGRIGGLCGGYQMLGEIIRDPDGVEGDPGHTAGLGCLPLETTLEKHKHLTRTEGTWRPNGCFVSGYEIHMGRTRAAGPGEPLLERACSNGRPVTGTDGWRRPDGRVWGTYLHGLFDEVEFRQAFLRELRPGRAGGPRGITTESQAAHRERQIDRLARHVEPCLDMARLGRLLGMRL